jgi:outer membrane biosynthesis protein TonB
VPGTPLEATFDHGEEGYGLWLDPAVQDDPVYAEHWAGHRPVVVVIEEGQIVIRRAGEDEPEAEASSEPEPEAEVAAVVAVEALEEEPPAEEKPKPKPRARAKPKPKPKPKPKSKAEEPEEVPTEV